MKGECNMSKISLFTVIIFAILLITGCTKTATVSGTIAYREKIALPSEGVVISIKVEDVSLADAPAVTIGEQIIENPTNQVPLPFEIEYNPANIDERYTYAMRVRIEVDDKLWFVNTTHLGVITRGNPTSNIEVVLEKVGPKETLALEDMTWVLESYGDPNNPTTVLKDTEITAEFKSTEGTIVGSAGCNGYFVAYEIDDGSFTTLGPIGSTAMACPEAIMNQEQAYLSILGTGGAVVVEDDILLVTSDDQVLLFKRQPFSDAEETLTNTFDFAINTEGWVGGFSDLPVNHAEHGYDVEFRYSDIPVEGEEGGGLLFSGNNHSDDLFMYAMRAFNSQDGLKPNTAYEIPIAFDLATNVAPGMMGIGGSPGESVYIKAGVVNTEPKSEEDTTGGEEYYRLNIDKGNQANSGEDMIVLGNAAKGEGLGQDDESFQYKHFNYEFQVMTNDNGGLWVIIGADSGFEGISQLYLDNISITFKEMIDTGRS
ncbi:YbaY family lipoprotein [Chloroflexota bacterium]